MARKTYKERIKDAVADEDYEQAAIIRDEAKCMKAMQKLIDDRSALMAKKRTKAVEGSLQRWDVKYAKVFKRWKNLRKQATR